MGLIGSLFTRIALTVAIPAVGFVLAQHFLPKQYRPSQMAQVIKSYEQKRANPLATTEEIERALASGSPVDATKVEAMLDDEQAVTRKEEGPEIAIEGNGYTDPSAIDRINQMHIPEKMKKEILASYERTGILPAIVTNGASRDPASETRPQSEVQTQPSEAR